MRRILLAILTTLLLSIPVLSLIGALPIYIMSSGILALIVLGILLSYDQHNREVKKTILEQNLISTKVSLAEEKARFQSIFEMTHMGIALVSLEGKFLHVNPAFSSLYGYTDQDIINMNFFNIVDTAYKQELQLHIQRLIDKDISSYSSEQQWLKKNGETLWIMSTLTLIRNASEQPAYFILQIQNISLQKKAEERLRHMAYHDPLTGLANRNKLEQFITHILASARRHQQGFALLFLDLDRFKNINDTIGHEAGDLLLQVIADRLKKVVRNTDMVARLGGDEFVLLITDVKKTEAVALIAKKILDSVLQAVMINGQEIYITTSIGLSIFPHDGQNMQALMKSADLALYRAKEHGRNNYQFYTVEMTGKAHQKMALQNALCHALNKQEFILHYQPKLDLASRKITGVEVLLRWKNNEYSAISQEEIISLAEETGFIIPISEWILKTACQQLKTWQALGFSSLTLAFNCCARQFKQSTFVDDVLAAIESAGISPQSLEIEVTEATIMQDPENILRSLYALKKVGVQIVIDDFGTGYWSLANLRRLSIDKIKIDKTFIKHITEDETSAMITRGIIAMLKKLEIKSIAEGVETREQYEFLSKEGCAEIQGYYLTQPLTVESMTHFLNHPIPDAEKIVKSEINE